MNFRSNCNIDVKKETVFDDLKADFEKLKYLDVFTPSKEDVVMLEKRTSYCSKKIIKLYIKHDKTIEYSMVLLRNKDNVIFVGTNSGGGLMSDNAMKYTLNLISYYGL